VERIPEKRPQALPERHHLIAGTEVFHRLVALGAQRLTAARIRFREAATAIMNLALTAVPAGGFSGVVMTIVVHCVGCPDP
jgi:hypothetical protein